MRKDKQKGLPFVYQRTGTRYLVEREWYTPSNQGPTGSNTHIMSFRFPMNMPALPVETSAVLKVSFHATQSDETCNLLYSIDLDAEVRLQARMQWACSRVLEVIHFRHRLGHYPKAYSC